MTKHSTTRAPTHAAPLSSHPLQIICRCDSMAAVRAAAENGADGICLAWRHSDSSTDPSIGAAGLVRAIRYARDRHCEVVLDLQGSLDARHWLDTRRFLERAATAGVDGILTSDPALMLYWKTRYPGLRIHHLLTEKTANIEAIRFLRREFGIAQMVLPHPLSMRQLDSLLRGSPVALAVPGRSHFLSSINAKPASAPFSAHLWTATAEAPQTLDLGPCSTGEAAANDAHVAPAYHTEADTLHLLARLGTLGVKAIWVETPVHAPFRLAEATKVWRAAIDRYQEDPAAYTVSNSWRSTLRGVLEGVPRK